MKSPFKIIKCCLHNDESRQDHQMLFVQWRVPSRSTNVVDSIWWSWRDSSLYKQHLFILEGLFIVQTTFVDLEGTLHCTNNICLSWRDSSLYKQHLLILKGLIIVQTAFDDLGTMMSPFKIIKCSLYNNEFLQDHQMLFAQWWVPSRSSNAVCTMMRTLHCTNNMCWSWKDSSLYKQHLMILKELIIVQTAFVDLEGTHHCADSIWWSWRDSSLCRQNLMILKGLFVVQTTFDDLEGTSPFKIIKCCLYNEESL
jgi:hypothetical protein